MVLRVLTLSCLERIHKRWVPETVSFYEIIERLAERNTNLTQGSEAASTSSSVKALYFVNN